MHLITSALQKLGEFAHRRRQNGALHAQVRNGLDIIKTGDFIAALSLWEEVLTKWPDQPVGYRGVIQCARETGNFYRANTVIREALQRFPDDPFIIGESAITRERQGDWKVSAALWEKVVEWPKAPPIWLRMYGHDLLVLGRHDEVESLLTRWRARFPNYHGFLAVEGFLAEARQDWGEAAAIWDDYRKRFPNEMEGWAHYGQSQQARHLARLDQHLDRRADLPEPAVPEKVEIFQDEETRVLLLGFESIGADCEFGLVQRRFGAEPLGLLRFNAVKFEGLMAAIAQRFDGMGDPDVTEMITLSNGEYFIRDRRWGLGMHTFMFQGQFAADIVYPKFCRRIAFLKEKLLADFAEARKVFVFLSSTLSLGDLQTLHRALRSLGPVSLLNVRVAPAPIDGIAPGRPGEAIEIDLGLFVGYLGRPGRTPSGFWDITFDDWIAVCKSVKSIAAAGLIDAEPEGHLDVSS